MRLKDIDTLLATTLNPVRDTNAIRLLSTDMLLMPSIHFIAAVTKHGKTNLAANVVCSTLSQVSDKKVFVGLNEETPQDFLVRCGCIFLNLSFTAWKTNKFTGDMTRRLADCLRGLVQRVRFVDEDLVNLGCLEDSEAAVRQAATSDQVSLVIFDYLQNVYLSKVYQGRTQYELSKLFGTQLKDIGKSAKCPVVVFGQLKDQQDQGFKSRVEGDSWFVNNVATGIELVADKTLKQSRLVVHVDRFQGRTHDEFYFRHESSGKLTQVAPPEDINE